MRLSLLDISPGARGLRVETRALRGHGAGYTLFYLDERYNDLGHHTTANPAWMGVKSEVLRWAAVVRIEDSLILHVMY